MSEKDKFLGEYLDNLPSDRGKAEYLANFDLKENNLQNKIILDLGAGVRAFARDMKESEVKAHIVSLDPLYMFSRDERQKIFERATDNYSREMVQRLSTDPALDSDTIGAVAKHLPFGDNKFDIILASWSISYYSESKEEIEQSLIEAVRVLKPGGQIRLRLSFSRNRQVSEFIALLADDKERILQLGPYRIRKIYNGKWLGLEKIS